MAKLAPYPRFRAFDMSSGSAVALSGGKIYTYIAGTSTPKTTYTDSAAGTPNANPVILDSQGYADIWLDGTYKFIIKDANDVLVSTTDSINADTFSDSNFRIQDNGDATKQLAFELSGFSTATTRTLTPPNYSGTIATLAGTETFSNKTLASPVFTTLQTTSATTGSAALPTKQTGVLAQLGNADTVATGIELDSFGANTAIWAVRANGTIASKTALASATSFLNINGIGYDGSAYSTRQVSILLATGNNTWSGSDHGTTIRFEGTPDASTTIAEWARFQNANFGIGVSLNMDTTARGNLAIANGTAPNAATATINYLYSKASATSDSNLYTLDEAGYTERLTGLGRVVTTQFDKTSDNSLANITGLTFNVEAGRTYDFEAVLGTTSNASGGIKAAISGTATATSIFYDSIIWQTGATVAPGVSRATALNTTVANVTSVTAGTIIIKGTIKVNAAGTLTVQFAQNASNGTASSVLVNSTFKIKSVN